MKKTPFAIAAVATALLVSGCSSDDEPETFTSVADVIAERDDLETLSLC